MNLLPPSLIVVWLLVRTDITSLGKDSCNKFSYYMEAKKKKNQDWNRRTPLFFNLIFHSVLMDHLLCCKHSSRPREYHCEKKKCLFSPRIYTLVGWLKYVII